MKLVPINPFHFININKLRRKVVWNIRYEKWIFSIIILLVLALSVQGVMGASNSSHLSEAPLNPEFIEYHNTSHMLEKVNNIKFKQYLGDVPEPIDTTYLNGKKVSKKALVAEAQGIADVSAVDMGDISSAPATYDLRTLGRVSPVKNQGNCGSCWAFATYGSMESTALPGQMFDFSENNLKNTNGFDNGPCDGGNSGMSTAYLARWGGPVAEVDDPYNALSSYSPTNLPVQEHAQEILIIPGRSGPLDNDNIKAALQITGALHTNLWWDDSLYNDSSKAYYYNGTPYHNHAVTIVGWNDSFSKTNFNQIAPGDGAFIIKNSWGTSWGDNGYFYISYYDSRIGKSLAAYSGESVENYNHIYQYDPLGMTQNLGYTDFLGVGSDTAWAANVFTATSAESLKAVGFYTDQVDTTYQVFIYTNPDQGPISSAGPVSTIQGTIGIPGYHSITLATPVSLNPGQKFSVVVRFQTPNYFYPIPIEMPISGLSSQATASAGQSYTSSTGSSWTDLTVQYPNTNVCLKAYTVTKLPVATFSATPTFGTAPLAVMLNDTSTNSPTEWNWSFTNVTGNNTPVWFSTQQNPTYTFGVGNYSIVLNASNSVGYNLSAQNTFINVTTPNLPPVASFDYGVPFVLIIPRPPWMDVVFYDTSTNSPTEWNWSFNNVTGNNTPVWFSTEQNPAYTFGVGNYSIVLNASNSIGYNLSAQVTFINVTAAPIRTTNVGVFRGLGYWYLDMNNNGTWDGSPHDTEFSWGKQPGDIPITGDWNRDGITETGIFRPGGSWFLDINNNGTWDSTPTDKTFSWGKQPGDIPITGDWNHDGITETGIFRPGGTWYLDMNNNGTWDSSPTDRTFSWGKQPGDIPITGDWNGNGITETGIFRAGGHWYLDTNNNGTWDGSPLDTEFSWGKQPGDVPITGDWNGDGITETGIFRPGTGFYLDMNNNGQYDGPSIDRFLPWGLLQPNDKPVTGKW